MKKLKGTAYIELIDEKTGEVESVKEDNMLTNALNHMFNDGIFNHCSYYTTNTNNRNSKYYLWAPEFWTPLPKNTIGGILLFSDNIPEDPEQIYAPGDVHCMGYASIDGYNKTNSFRGSFNPTESGYLEESKGKGYRFVWNFTTSQANGEIKCVALTTPFGGRFGYGMSLDSQQRETMSSVCHNYTDKTSDLYNWYHVGSFYSPGDIQRMNGHTGRYQYIKGNTGYDCYFSGDDKTNFIIQKIDFSTTGITLMGKQPNTTSILETHTIPISIFTNNRKYIYSQTSYSPSSSSFDNSYLSDFYNNIHSYVKYLFDNDGSNSNGYLYLIATTNNGYNNYELTGTQIFLAKINLDTYELMYEKTIALNNFRTKRSAVLYNGVIRKGNLYLMETNSTYANYNGTGYHVLKIDTNNNDTQTIINLPIYTNNSYNMNSDLFSQSPFVIKDRIIIPTGYIIDLNDEILYYPVLSSGDSSTNTSIASIGNYYTRSGEEITPMLTYAYRYGSKDNHTSYGDMTQTYGVSFYTPCLFTINNLTTPITKTQDKAMKITYILREEE